MNRLHLSALMTCLLAAFTLVVRAQVDCPTLVKTALETADHHCSTLGRNQACYGNIQLKATTQDGKTLTFNQSGDIANVVDLKALELSSMSLTDESWGVALMKLQANLPGTLPGQNVTFLLFGNVQIDDADGVPVELEMTARRGVNVRLRPVIAANNVIGSLKVGQAVTVNGRLKDGSWLRMKTEDGTGWVAADFLKSTEDMNRLHIVKPEEPVFGPMQAFSFSTGIGDRPCAEAPDSGILIQTPKGGQRVTFNVNGVTVDVGSTVYLQAQPSNALTVTVLQGAVKLTANGVSQGVPAGTVSRVKLDATGQASGTPTYPEPYDQSTLLTLPVSVGLPDKIVIQPPLQKAKVETAVETATAIADGLPLSGEWGAQVTVTRSDCPGPKPNYSLGDTGYWTFPFTFSDDWQTLSYDNDFSNVTFVLHRTADNTYSTTMDNNYGNYTTVTVSFPTPTTFQWSRDY